MFKQAIILFYALLLTGCSEIIPTVNFDSFDVRELTFKEADVDFVFWVNNPNPIDISLAALSYDLGFEDISLVNGDAEDGFALSALSGSELRLPVGLVFEQAWDAVDATRGEDEIGFFLDGSFGFDTDTEAGQIDIPYREEGEFPALRTPTFGLSALRVSSIDYATGATQLDLELAVDNDHGSTFWFDAFDYDLTMDGSSFAAGALSSLGSVDGATTEVLSLPIEANLFSVSTSVYNAIVNQERVQLGLSANMDVDTPFGIIPLSISEDGNLNVDL